MFENKVKAKEQGVINMSPAMKNVLKGLGFYFGLKVLARIAEKVNFKYL